MKSTPRAILFWDGHGYSVADQTTETELAGPYPDLHAAWLEAHSRGLRVTVVQTTRGTVKHRALPKEQVA